MQKRYVVILYGMALLLSCSGNRHFTEIRSEDGIEIREDGKKVLFYQKRPKSVNGAYERAGYIHPLYSLNEKPLTEDSPPDHLFHRGIFWAWHQIILHDKKIADGWVSENISWVPVKADIASSRKSVTLRTEMLWRSAPEHKDTIDIIRERTTITIYRSTSRFRMIDFDISLYALVDSLKIGGSDDLKGYGGFCLRLNLPSDIRFISGTGEVTPLETSVKGGNWVDFNGSFEGSNASKTGITAFDNPHNPDHAQQWILRKEKSMQNIAYPGRVPVSLSREGMNLKYRLVIHNNEIGTNGIDSLYNQYIRKN